jgi:hypothetical protein
MALGLWLWGVLFGLVWLNTSGCLERFDATCNSAPLDAAQRFILLGWVKEYQTLLAGFLAFGAGIFVVVGAMLTGDAQRASRDAEIRERNLSAAAITGQRFIDAAVAIRNDEIYAQELDFTIVDAHLPDLARIDTMLATVVRAATREAVTALRKRVEFLKRTPIFGRSSAPHHADHLVAAAECYAIAEVLYHVEKHLDERGKFNFYQAGNIPVGRLKSHLRFLNLSPQSLGPLRGFFDWSSW